MQLSTIEEQNSQRDSTLKPLEKDIQDTKENKRSGDNAEETPKSKRCRKSPRGLSVSCQLFVSLLVPCRPPPPFFQLHEEKQGTAEHPRHFPLHAIENYLYTVLTYIGLCEQGSLSIRR